MSEPPRSLLDLLAVFALLGLLVIGGAAVAGIALRVFLWTLGVW